MLELESESESNYSQRNRNRNWNRMCRNRPISVKHVLCLRLGKLKKYTLGAQRVPKSNGFCPEENNLILAIQKGQRFDWHGNHFRNNVNNGKQVMMTEA